MVMLAAVPLLSLVLIRMLWSGSSLWFLTVGIILLGSAAVVFLARRQQDEYGRVLAQETSRIPMVLAALGVLFLAMLLLPNFADGDSGGGDLSGLAAQQQQEQQSSGLSSEVSGVQQQSQPTAVQQQQAVVQAEPTVAPQVQQPEVSEEVSSSVGGTTYTVVDGDTLWDIADRFGTDVESIVAANDLEDEADIQIGQELIIPESDASDATLEDDTVE
jgi:LysM repeat protein